MNKKKIFTFLTITTLNLNLIYSTTASFDTLDITSMGSQKNIKLISFIKSTAISVKLNYNSSEFSGSLTGFDISKEQTTEEFDILFSGRLNNTEEFYITITPGEFIQKKSDVEIISSGITPLVISSYPDISKPIVDNTQYNNNNYDTFITNLYPGLNYETSGVNFKFKWNNNPEISSGEWSSVNIISVTST